VKTQAAAVRRLSTTWGTRRIDFSLVIEPRRDLLIAVHPDLRVQVRGPEGKSLERILERVEARRSWIARQLSEFEQLTPLPPPRFVSGEAVMYLGRAYRLRIDPALEGAALRTGRLHVGARKHQRARIRRLVDDWYRERAASVFARRIERLQKTVAAFDALRPHVRIRRMTRRWGSCARSGSITLNPALVQAPPACIDYVLAHEMTHLLELAHSARFYRLLNEAMPDWRPRRERLAAAVVRWS